MLRIGLVGVGQHARWAVIPAIRETSKAWVLVAACDISEQNFDILRDVDVPIFTDYERMYREVELDAVYVATLVDAHFEPAVSAFRRGLYVVCEKPLADDVEKCRAMVAEAEQARKELVVVFETRYHPHNRKVKAWIDEGHLGVVEAIHFQHFWDGHKASGHLAPRRARAIEGTGSLDCGIHQLDLARYFVGGEWNEVSAIGTWFGEELSNPPHVGMMGRLSSKVMVTLNCSFAYGAYIEPRPRSHVVTVVGTKGVISFCDDEDETSAVKLVAADLSDSVAFESVPHSLAIGWLLDDFAEVLRGRKPKSPELATGHDGLMAQIAVEEALKQCRVKRPASDS
jgi:predicted dehydrogenase